MFYGGKNIAVIIDIRFYFVIFQLDEILSRRAKVNDAFDKLVKLRARLNLNSNKEYKSRVTFKDLNEDCICDIIQWLPLKNKIGVERVCRKWRRAVITNLEDQEEVVLRENTKKGKRPETSFNEIYLHQHKLKNRNLNFALKRMTGIESIYFVNLKAKPSQFWTYFDKLYQPVKSFKCTNCVFSSSEDKSWEKVKDFYPFEKMVSAEFENCELESEFVTMLFSRASQSLKKLSFRKCKLKDHKNPFAVMSDNLETLEIGNLCNVFDDSFTNEKSDFSFAQSIKRLELGAVALDGIAGVFQVMPGIESFAFEFVPSIDNDNEIKGGELNIFKDLKSLSIKSRYWWHLVFTDEVERFEKLESLSLCGVITGPLDLEELCEKIPNVSNLLLDYKVDCEGEHENGKEYSDCSTDDDLNELYEAGLLDSKKLRARDPCQHIFLRPLSELRNLRRLEVYGANEESLSNLIREDLSELRQLIVGNVRDEDLVEAFAESAKKKPKEAFSLHLKGGLKDIDICHIDFPRNLQKHHLPANFDRCERDYYHFDQYEFGDNEFDDYFDYENDYDSETYWDSDDSCPFPGPSFYLKNYLSHCFDDSD